MSDKYDVLNNLINKKINSKIEEFSKQLDKDYFDFKENLLKTLKNNLNKTKLEIIQINSDETLLKKEFLKTLRILLINNEKIESDDCIGIAAKDFYSSLKYLDVMTKRDMNILLLGYDAVKTQKNKSRVTCFVKINGNVVQVINIKKDFINKYNLLEGEE